MRKLAYLFIIIILIIGILNIGSTSAYALSSSPRARNTPTAEPTEAGIIDRAIDSEQANQLVAEKEKFGQELEKYKEKYQGNSVYGMVGFILDQVRFYSIPLCILGMMVGAIFQYVIGIRKLDVRDKGLQLIVTFLTIFVICQVLPFIFTMIVVGFRS
jgi:hypothetical protein